MGIRPKSLLIFLAVGVVPVVALSVFIHLSGVRAVESRLRGELQREARGIALDFEKRLGEREAALAALARSPALRAYVRAGGDSVTGVAGASSSQLSMSQSPTPNASPTASADSDQSVPEDVRGEVRTFIQSGEKYYAAVACLNTEKHPLFRAESNKTEDEQRVRFQTSGFLPASVSADERVWSVAPDSPLPSMLTRQLLGPILRYTIPVFVEERDASAERGALIVDLRLDALLDDVAGKIADINQARASDSLQGPSLIVILDREGTAVYHSNTAFKYQRVTVAMPASFKPVNDAMSEGREGWQFYKEADGNDWLAAYQPLAPLNLSVAVAGDYSSAVQSLSRRGWMITGLILLAALVVGVVLSLLLRRTTRSIERVTEGAVAIASGKLDQRIEVRSSDETRLLAESVNAMTDRLSEQIAREAESRQFESFMRLSAMLTHDLKNSIQALSLVVSNMGQQAHDEAFRADAMKALSDATDKLRSLVAKLSEPVRSLSGEFKRPRPVDLIPVLRRTLAVTAEPAAEMHEIEIELPPTLVAVADDERIEKVMDNLVLNALDAMGAKRGRLTVTAGPAEEGFVFFSVSDTGVGMTKEFQRTRLFRPFATTKSKGVGLGLYTCRELIRALGGRVEVESERGSGTTFRIVLPSGEIKGATSKKGRRTE